MTRGRMASLGNEIDWENPCPVAVCPLEPQFSLNIPTIHICSKGRHKWLFPVLDATGRILTVREADHLISILFLINFI